MTIKFILTLLLFACNASSNKEATITKQDNSIYIFVGYQEHYPVFKVVRGENQNQLLVLSGDKLSLLQKYSKGNDPIFVRDNLILFSQKDKLIVQDGNLMQEYSVNGIPQEATVNEDNSTIYFSTNLYDGVYQLNVKSKKQKEILAEGYKPDLVHGKIFYIKSSSLGSGYVDVHSFDLQSEGSTLVITGVYEEGYYVLPTGDHIACNLPIEGQVHQSVYSILTDKFYLFDNKELGGFHYPAYDFSEKSLIYYKPKGLKKRLVPLPSEYNYTYKP
ncbi:MAG: hypothetical protein AAF519_15875 [Bacteroidota bacterium]